MPHLGAVGKQLFHFDTVAVRAPATGRNRTPEGEVQRVLPHMLDAAYAT